jgi:ATP-binding cassette subfamily D (ALD) long-chain fatty acid import protein
LASLYSNLGKPVLDIAIFNYQLAKSIGFYGFTGLTLNYFFTLFLIRSATPPFGKMAVEEANLEGGFRSAHSRLITNAEEIGFYNGEELEKHILDRNYSRLVKHLNDVLRIRISYNMFEDFLIKYSWSAVGLLLSSIPVFYPDVAGSRIKQMMSEEVPLIEAEDSPTVIRGKAGSHTQHFITNKRLMNNLADAGGRVMYSYKELSELAGFTHRVYSMFEVFEDLRNNRYLDTSSSSQKYTIGSQNGEYQVTETAISFLHTPIVTPFGDTILIEDLSFQISCGDHLMVTGPNGSGKSSILRVLAGIWPHFSGTIARPPHDLSAIMYIPQRPYLVMGSLRDQVIYPDTYDQMKAKNVTDDDLQVILKTVYLDYITLREGGWESVKEWKDVFSGGSNFLT